MFKCRMCLPGEGAATETKKKSRRLKGAEDTQGSSVATLPDILCSKDLSYPICSRRRLLHPLVGIVPPVAFVLSTKSTCKGHCPSSLGAL
ncbi:hypothetical protein BHM03_00030941 [Ensete ventricosum]|nr:hypothetical protein BHM03_00030941 [Ensete ventricosum]